MGEFRMPSLGADMDAGTVVEWRVTPGDAVHRGDIVAVVDTDKADIDVEIFETGSSSELLVPGARRCPVGTRPGDRADGRSRVRRRRRQRRRRAPASGRRRPRVPSTVDGAPGRPRPSATTPVVRRLAQHLGVDLADVDRAPDLAARITRDDVERAAGRRRGSVRPAPPTAPPHRPPEPPGGETTAGDRR